MKTYFFVFLFILSGKTLFCQINHPKKKEEMIGVCDQFMEIFKKGKYTDAFNLIKSYTAIEDYKLDTLADLANHQLKTYATVYGKVFSYEQLPEKSVKSSLSRIAYLLKFEKKYLQIRFV